MQSTEYADFTRPHERFLRQILVDLEFFVTDTGLARDVFSIESRVKSFESAAAKASRIGIPIQELQDIAGIRVVVATRQDVDGIAYFFERRASISQDLVIKKNAEVKHTTGYRSTHLITEFSGHYSRSVHSGNLEVQIPTIFEHAFNFVSHSWVYKSSTVHDQEWQAQFKSMSLKLVELDELAERLHHTSFDSAELDPGRQRLTPLVYQRVLREEFGEECDLKSAVSTVGWYFDLGVTTMQQMQAFYRRQDIKEMWDEYQAVLPSSSRASFWSMFGTRMPAAHELLESLRQKLENSTGPDEGGAG